MDIQLYGFLRQMVGAHTIGVDVSPGMTLAQILEQAFGQHPTLRPKVLDGEGHLQSAVQVLVNGCDARRLNRLETAVAPDDAVRIFPPIGGG
jgi:molybdopterin converting factor small subunit